MISCLKVASQGEKIGENISEEKVDACGEVWMRAGSGCEVSYPSRTGKIIG